MMRITTIIVMLGLQARHSQGAGGGPLFNTWARPSRVQPPLLPRGFVQLPSVQRTPPRSPLAAYMYSTSSSSSLPSEIPPDPQLLQVSPTGSPPMIFRRREALAAAGAAAAAVLAGGDRAADAKDAPTELPPAGIP